MNDNIKIIQLAFCANGRCKQRKISARKGKPKKQSAMLDQEGRSPQENRVIFHIDLDAFFASCEERENPHFRGKPIIVGADPKNGLGRGVVSTANYIRRKYGVHSAMPISRAYRLCPQAIFLPVNSALYSRVSQSVMAILQNFAQKHKGKFEQVSIDEAYLDLNKYFEKSPSPRSIAATIKQKIYRHQKIHASIGVGPNMLIAKIASDFQRPDGLTIVKQEEIQKFLDPLPIRKLPGIGPKTEQELKGLGIYIVADLRKLPQATLYENFGQHGIALYEHARGIDRSQVAEQHEVKSVGEERTFAQDTASAQKILPILFSLVKNVLKSAHRDGYKNFKTITIKIRYADFQTHTKSLSSNYDIENKGQIEKVTLKLLWPFLGKQKIRLIGFRIGGFV